MSDFRRVDVLVVGAGPAGLCAFHSLARSNVNVTLIDAGPALHDRRHDEPSRLTRGVGGAGLFSDGKFSFYPAATKLWQLPNENRLQRAYSQAVSSIELVGVEVPQKLIPNTGFSQENHVGWREKRYPVLYIPLDKRLSLCRQLIDVHAPLAQVLSNTELVNIRQGPTYFEAECTQADKTLVIQTRDLIVATGRFTTFTWMPLVQQLGWPSFDGRFEIGVRLDAESTHPLFRNLKGNDPKWTITDCPGATQWRTFCTCRDGEVVATEDNEIVTISGRSDVSPTGRTSVAVLTRGLVPEQWPEDVEKYVRTMAEKSFSIPLNTWLMQQNDDVWVNQCKLGVTLFLERFLWGGSANTHAQQHDWRLFAEENRAELDGVTVHGYCVEGTGRYLGHGTGQLQIVPNVWVAGDGVGIFRGIVGSMVSGFYVADEIISSCLGVLVAEKHLRQYGAVVTNQGSPTPQDIACPNCKAPNKPDASLCWNCRLSLAAPVGSIGETEPFLQPPNESRFVWASFASLAMFTVGVGLTFLAPAWAILYLVLMTPVMAVVLFKLRPKVNKGEPIKPLTLIAMIFAAIFLVLAAVAAVFVVLGVLIFIVCLFSSSKF